MRAGSLQLAYPPRASTLANPIHHLESYLESLGDVSVAAGVFGAIDGLCHLRREKGQLGLAAMTKTLVTVW